MMDAVGRRVRLKSFANFRDLGGLPLASGAVRRGEVFRSATLARLSDEDMPRFESLGIGTVYDLRTSEESSLAPDRLPLSVRLSNLDVLADGTHGIASDLAKLRSDPASVNALLAGNRAEEILERIYREFVTLPSARRSYRVLFEGLAQQDRGGAVLFHCTAGKDRTGWAAAVLLLLLGAGEQTVLDDYLQTNADYLPTLERFFADAEQLGVEVEPLRAVYSVKREYLEAGLDEVAKLHGSVERYALEGLGLTSETLDVLRTRLVE